MNLIDARNEIDAIYAPPMQAVSDCLRGFLIPEKHKDFIAVDLAQIEARKIAWLAGEDKVLDAYRTHGKVYEMAAASVYKKPMTEVTKDERQIGKVAELALGFGGGKGAFQMMAKGYGVKVSDDEAEEIKVNWRLSRPETTLLWRKLQDAAFRAICNKGREFHVTNQHGVRISYKVAGSFLWCKLPSTRVLCYPYPKIETVKAPWGDDVEAITYMGEDSFTKKWEKQTTYGGKLAENVTQASSRDVLVEAMWRLENKNYPIVAHVHDEIICEVDEGYGSLEEVISIVTQIPRWAKGLPIAAEGWRGKRYRK